MKNEMTEAEFEKAVEKAMKAKSCDIRTAFHYANDQHLENYGDVRYRSFASFNTRRSVVKRQRSGNAYRRTEFDSKFNWLF